MQILRILDKIIEVAAVLAFAASSLLILLNVFNRYVIFGWLRNLAKSSEEINNVYLFLRNSVGSWSIMADEVPGLLLVWIAFLGAYLVLRKDGHISFDMLLEAVPLKVGTYLRAFNIIVFGLFVSVLLWQSIRMIKISGRTEIETASIAQGWFMAVLPITALLFILALVVQFLAIIRKKRD